MSRLAFAQEAVRPALKARAMLSGAPGSGKTRTALIVAEVLAAGDPILVIDTERESALTYADDFTFKHLRWTPPFDPRELGREVVAAGNDFAVVVVDSMSHFWRGDGGTLDIANGKFTGWADARPAQADMVEGILSTAAHLIICTRSKVAHEQVQEGGRWVVKKLGMAAVQDDDLEYELNVALDLDMDHTLTVAKSRTVAVPVGRQFKSGHAQDFANLYAEWLAGGEPLASKAEVDALVERMNGIGDESARKACKQEFLSHFGRPEHLRESQLVTAAEFIGSHEAGSDA